MAATRLQKFLVENYTSWRRCFQAHLISHHEDMWLVIEEGPIKIQKVNTNRITLDQPEYVEKPHAEWTLTTNPAIN